MSVKYTITFSSFYIPVALHPVDTGNEITFHQVNTDTLGRIKYKKVDELTGDEVKEENIAKAYEYEKNEFVIIDNNDLKSLKAVNTKLIEIQEFVKSEQINPIYYHENYYIIPAIEADYAYLSLAKVLKDKCLTGIAKAILANKETIIALRPVGDMLLASTLYYYDDIDHKPFCIAYKEVKDKDLSVMRSIITSLIVPFDIEKYRDEYKIRQKKLIDSKITEQFNIIPPDTAKTPPHIYN